MPGGGLHVHLSSQVLGHTFLEGACTLKVYKTALLTGNQPPHCREGQPALSLFSFFQLIVYKNYFFLFSSFSFVF